MTEVEQAQGWQGLKPVFLDIEASGLQGWPIEIGWAELVDDRVTVESHLLRPDPAWDLEAWDETAEHVHGLSLSRLVRDGKPAHLVAELAFTALDGRLVVSDAAAYDMDWLQQLLELQPQETDIVVRDVAWLVRHFETAGRSGWHDALAGLPAVHRAGGDAARLARAWQTVLAA
jgi:DNA polymerase III epsilon subunit-like protein